METIVGDTHVHVPYIKDGTSKTIKGAIANGLDFIVLAYHTHATEKFDEFLARPNIGEGFEVIPMGGIAKVIYSDEKKAFTRYVIKGQELKIDTHYIDGVKKTGLNMDILVWPAEQEINPAGKSFLEIKDEITKQNALLVFPHQSKGGKDLIRKIGVYADAFEYSYAPKILTADGNENLKEASERYNRPLMAGSDSRWPGSAISCTSLEWDHEVFWAIKTKDDFMLNMREKIKTAQIVGKHSNLLVFSVDYLAYFMTALRVDTKGTLRSFKKSHF